MTARGRVLLAASLLLLLAGLVALLRPARVAALPGSGDPSPAAPRASSPLAQAEAGPGPLVSPPAATKPPEPRTPRPPEGVGSPDATRASRRARTELPTFPGRVIDRDTGLPIRRAHVRSVSMALTHTNTQHAWTDADGAFAAPVSPDATSTWLEVSAEGYPTQHFYGPLGPGARDPAPLALLLGAPLSGRVVAEDGTPVPGAFVDARPVGEDPWRAAQALAKSGAADWVALGTGESQVLAGADGAFTTGSLAAGTPHVVTVRPGRGGPVIAEVRDARPPANLTLVARGHAELRVRVVGPVVPGSWRVDVRYMGSGNREATNGLSCTGSEGRLAIPPGEIDVSLVTEGGAAALAKRGLRATAGETLDVEWPVGDIAGALRPTLTLVFPPGERAPGFVTLLQSAGQSSAGEASYRDAIAGPEGPRVHEAPAGALHLIADADGEQCLVGTADVPQEASGSTPLVVTMRLVRTATILVRMRGEEVPLVGLRRVDGYPVVAWGQAWPGPDGFVMGMEDGTEISTLLPGDYEVGTGPAEVTTFPHRVSVREGETVEVTLP